MSSDKVEILTWPPSKGQLEYDRIAAFKKWQESSDRWVFNWFSDFLTLKVPLVYQGFTFKTIEAFYQAMKSKDLEYREAIAKCETPNKTKFLAGKLARLGEVRDDWEDIKIEVMKFAQKHRIETDPVFYDKLRGTRGRYLYEFNNWSDYFWGLSIYTGQGENVLGRILVHLRDEVYFPSKIRRG